MAHQRKRTTRKSFGLSWPTVGGLWKRGEVVYEVRGSYPTIVIVAEGQEPIKLTDLEAFYATYRYQGKVQREETPAAAWKPYMPHTGIKGRCNVKKHLPRLCSLEFGVIRHLMGARVTCEITAFSGPRDVCTLSNGMQVGRLTCESPERYFYPMLLIGNLAVAPEGPKGSVTLKDFLACLNTIDADIVLGIAAKVIAERVKRNVSP